MNKNKRKHIKWIVVFAFFGAVFGPAGRATAQTTANIAAKTTAKPAARAAKPAAKMHELKLIPANVTWGGIDGHTKPVLSMVSGDTVAVETEGYRVMDYLKFAGVPKSEIPDSLKEVESYGKAHGLSGSPTTGPIYMDGA